MSNRINVDAATLAALAAAHVTAFPLLELGFDSGTTYLAGVPHDVVYDGHTYQAALGLGTIEPVVESVSEIKGLVFTLSAVPGTNLALALTEKIKRRPVVMRFVVLDGTTLRVDPNVWSGVFDVMSFDDSKGAPQIRVPAEHRFFQMMRPRGNLSSHEDQQQRSPGDTFFAHAASMAEKKIHWPHASWWQTAR
jgi:hypothetical protein